MKIEDCYQVTVCCQLSVGTTIISMVGQPISGLSSQRHNTNIGVDFVAFRQFTDPSLLDALKPQLKLVQASVGDKEVADSLHLINNDHHINMLADMI